jgi:hypothetical protein
LRAGNLLDGVYVLNGCFFEQVGMVKHDLLLQSVSFVMPARALSKAVRELDEDLKTIMVEIEAWMEHWPKIYIRSPAKIYDLSSDGARVEYGM